MPNTSLTFLSPGAQSWQRFLLPEPQPGLIVSIGRGIENALVLNDSSVSTKHALLMVDPQGVYILDNNSSNGITVNGQWIAPNAWVNIPQGSTFNLGGTTFSVESIESPQYSASLPQQIAPPIVGTPVQPQIYPVAEEYKKKRSAIPFVVGGVALLFVIIAGIVLMLANNKNIKISGSSSSYKSNLSMTINADGQTITDENGISVTIPTNALDGTSAVLSTTDLPDELKQEMNQGYDLLSPAYSLTATGAADGSKPGILTFPAETDELRLVAIIDGLYIAELNIPPENGVISIDADLHPSDLGELAGTDPMWKNGSIQFALVRPKGNLQGNQGTIAKLAAPARQETPYLCVSISYVKCWQNGNASVQLLMDKSISITPVESNKVINYIQSTMDKYEKEGFDGAIYTARNPVQVVIIEDSGPPYYQVSNGVIYLPHDIAKKLAAGQSDDFLIHELAHWIQDENYYMVSAYFSNPDTWWIETSADNMAMLIDKDYIVRNLHTYAKLDVDEKTSVLQSSPYIWPTKEYYAQAQLVKVNLCEKSGCPVSKASFVTAINNGTYPYADESAKTTLHNNLSDYARYLLGFAPEKANTTIPLTGVSTGDEYGDSIIIKQSHDSAFNLEQYTGIGRMIPEQGEVPGMRIETTIQKDGVYVLRVEIAPEQYAPQWPAMLRVDPGVEIYYRLNNGEILHHDGKSELFIQPIMQGTTGQEVSKIRLVALGQQGGEQFKAHVGTIDLSGMWMVNMPDQRAWVNNIMCEKGDDKETIAKFTVPITAMQLMFGDFSTDTTAHLLTWTGNPDRVTAILSGLGTSSSTSESGSTFSAAATIDKALIHLEATAFEPEDTTFEVRPEAYSTQFISIPGTFQIKADFTNLTYFGIEDTSVTAGLPNIKAWELSGDNIRFIFDCELLVQRVNSAAQLEEEEKRNHCTGTIEVPASLSIYQVKK